MSPSSPRGKRPAHEKKERQFALRTFMEGKIKEGAPLSLSYIRDNFTFSPKPSKTTIRLDLVAIQCKKNGDVYTFFNTDEEKERLILEQNLGLLAKNVLYAGKRDIWWLPIRTEPDQCKKVAKALMETYPDLIFGCISNNNFVCAAFISQRKKKMVQEHLQELLQLTSEDIQANNFPHTPIIVMNKGPMEE